MKLRYAKPFLETGFGTGLVSGVLDYINHPWAQWFAGAAIVLLLLSMIIVAVTQYQGYRAAAKSATDTPVTNGRE